MLIKNSLKNKVITLCISLVLLTATTILVSFWWSTSRYSQAQADRNLNNAQNVFEQYLSAREELLVTAAQVLTADFGFKQAVASGDADTIASVLYNHSQRIRADLMLLSNLQGEIVASSTEQFQADNELASGLTELMANPGTTSFMLLNHSLYQVLVLPVKAPRTIAHTLVGFEINHQTAAELARLTGLTVNFYQDGATWLAGSGNSEASNKQRFLHQAQLSLFGERLAFNHRELALHTTAQHSVSALLSADLSGYYQEFDNLLKTVVALASLIVVLALLLSGVLAKNLTEPLQQLVSTARQFARGQYQNELASSTASSEVKTLFSAFSEMGQEIQRREMEVLYQAQHDSLTGLYNRHTMLGVVQQLLTLHPTQHYLLIAFNIKGFKHINDNLGPQMGDSCLRALAGQLQQLDETVALPLHSRLSGDEFLSILPMFEGGDADAVASDFMRQLSQPLQVKELQLTLRFSAGYSAFPRHGDEAKTLIRRSLIALEAARSHNEHCRTYQLGEDEAHLARLALIDDLKAALQADDGQLFMVYQPKMNLRNGKIDKVESLIRWQRPNHGFVSPELFISLAEQSGLIVELTQWVIQSVVKQLQHWQRNNLTIQAAINLSAQDLAQPDFKPFLLNTLQQYQVATELVTLELTERDMMDDEEQGIALLTELKSLGFTISVDDYGIGQSSLGKLRQLPVDELKLDKSFILKLDSSSDDQIIVQSTIALGHNLGLKVVAEGVENLASLELLKQMRCDHIQGYYLSKPLNANALVDWLAQYYQQQERIVHG